MQALEDATTIMRGYGVRLWFIFQSLGQVHECYGDKADVILDNIGTQQFFAVTSYKTAEEISKRIGDQTIQLASYNSNTSTSQQSSGGSGQASQSMGRSSGGGYSTSELGRRVLKPEEKTSDLARERGPHNASKHVYHIGIAREVFRGPGV